MVLLVLCALGLACEDRPVASEPVPPPTTMDGEPCDEAGVIDTGEGCEECVCTDEGQWLCPRTTCSWFYVPEPSIGLLVVADDSSSMGPDRQARLAAAMPAFLEVLDRAPDPIALRVAVTTTDASSPACDPATADDGALQLRSCRQRLDDFAVPAGPTEEPIPADAAARGCLSVCDLPQLRTEPSAIRGSSELRARPWLERHGDWSNLEGDPDFAAALACAIPQGLHGCDFESPLASTVAALHRALDPDDLAGGFADLGGPLAVLIVTDEADCSVAAEWGTVFDPEGSRRFWSDPEAEAATSAVCWNAGVVCEGGPGTYDACHPEDIDTAEHLDVPDDNAVLTPVSVLTRELWRLEQDGLVDVTLTAIAGVPPGYATGETELVYTDGSDDPDFALRYGVGPGCRDDDEAAVPPARLLDVADSVHSACDDDYGPALAALGESLVEGLSPGCYWSCAADADPGAAGLQPTCWAQEEWFDEDGSFRQRPVPLCDGDRLPEGADVCVTVRQGETLSAACVDGGYNLELGVRRDPTAPRPLQSGIRALCTTSSEPARDCPDLR